LDKDRNRRYETANAFAADVQRYLADEPVMACPPSAGYRLRKFASKHRKGLITVIAFAVLLVTAAVVSTWEAVVAHWAKGEAIEAEGRAKEKEREAGIQRGLAVTNAKTAQDNAKTAQDNERLVRRRYYATQMSKAQPFWPGGSPLSILGVLEAHRPRFDEEDLRTFEWYYLWGHCHQGLRVSRRVRKCFNHAVVYSPDGTMLVLAGSDGVVTFCDPATGQEGTTLPKTPFGRSVIAFSPDGKVLAQSAGRVQDEITLWDVTQRQPRIVLSGTGRALALAFAADGKTLASANEDGEVELWDPATGQRRLSIRAGTRLDSVRLYKSPDLSPSPALAFSPSGETLAVWWLPNSSAITLWDVTARPPKRIDFPNTGANHFAFSPDGKLLALDRQLWDLTAKTARASSWGSSTLHAVAFSPDGKAMAQAAQGSVTLVQLTPGKKERILPHSGTVQSVAFAPDGKSLAAVSSQGLLRVWDTSEQQLAETIDHPVPVTALACSHDMRTLAVGDGSGAVTLYDVASARPRATFKGHLLPVLALAFSADGQRLASTDRKYDPKGPAGSLKLWDVPAGQLLSDLVGSQAIPGFGTSLAFSADGKNLVCGGVRARLEVWDTRTFRLLYDKLSGSFALSSDGTELITRDASDNVCLWELPTGKLRRSFPTIQSGPVDYYELASSPEGQFLALTTSGGRIQLWDLETGLLRGVLPGGGSASLVVHADPKNTPRSRTESWTGGGSRPMVFLADGSTLAGTSGNSVTLWDVTAGQVRFTFPGSAVRSVGGHAP
jgi:WD40 repeat protein